MAGHGQAWGLAAVPPQANGAVAEMVLLCLRMRTHLRSLQD